jgi:hypothetical protein
VSFAINVINLIMINYFFQIQSLSTGMAFVHIYTYYHTPESMTVNSQRFTTDPPPTYTLANTSCETSTRRFSGLAVEAV